MIMSLLTLTYLSCVSSGAMLSMLLLLIGAYISASLWLLSQGMIYTGLLYILVYVGAIVVLIMFVVQLTNTSLTGMTSTTSTPLLLIQNTVLIICLIVLITKAYSLLDEVSLFNLSYLNLTQTWTYHYDGLVSNLESYLDPAIKGNNLSLLAFSLFNEYGYNLMISVHAILLAIIGPIKLAISDLNSNYSKH